MSSAPAADAAVDTLLAMHPRVHASEARAVLAAKGASVHRASSALSRLYGRMRPPLPPVPVQAAGTSSDGTHAGAQQSVISLSSLPEDALVLILKRLRLDVHEVLPLMLVNVAWRNLVAACVHSPTRTGWLSLSIPADRAAKGLGVVRGVGSLQVYCHALPGRLLSPRDLHINLEGTPPAAGDGGVEARARACLGLDALHVDGLCSLPLDTLAAALRQSPHLTSLRLSCLAPVSEAEAPPHPPPPLPPPQPQPPGGAQREHQPAESRGGAALAAHNAQLRHCIALASGWAGTSPLVCSLEDLHLSAGSPTVALQLTPGQHARPEVVALAHSGAPPALGSDWLERLVQAQPAMSRLCIEEAFPLWPLFACNDELDDRKRQPPERTANGGAAAAAPAAAAGAPAAAAPQGHSAERALTQLPVSGVQLRVLDLPAGRPSARALAHLPRLQSLTAATTRADGLHLCASLREHCAHLTRLDLVVWPVAVERVAASAARRARSGRVGLGGGAPSPAPAAALAAAALVEVSDLPRLASLRVRQARGGYPRAARAPPAGAGLADDGSESEESSEWTLRIAALPRLCALNISGCVPPFVSTIELEHLPRLGDEAVAVLLRAICRPPGPPPDGKVRTLSLGHLPCLERLDLDLASRRSALVTSPAPSVRLAVEHCPGLRTVSAAKAPGLSALALGVGLTHLTALHLPRHSQPALVVQGQLAALTHLHAAGTAVAVDQLLTLAAQAPRLAVLCVDQCQQLGGGALARLVAVRRASLEEVSARGIHHVDARGLANVIPTCARLRRLDLRKGQHLPGGSSGVEDRESARWVGNQAILAGAIRARELRDAPRIELLL